MATQLLGTASAVAFTLHGGHTGIVAWGEVITSLSLVVTYGTMNVTKATENIILARIVEYITQCTTYEIALYNIMRIH